MCRQRERGHRGGLLEAQALRSQGIEAGRLGSGVAVAAEGVGPHGVEGDQKQVCSGPAEGAETCPAHQERDADAQQGEDPDSG